ncbi:MAG: flagellar export chaperone FlgN [Acidobacteriota bacterium]|nr:flagellar export chaperone FlgN [Acidobacteriota bacterium]
MREYLEKLLSLLEHKHEILGDLIDRQETFKRFLIKPEWARFYQVTLPQEQLLNRLRQIQSAQDYLLAELAKRLRLKGHITVKGLCPCLEPEWQRALLAATARIREDVERLQNLTRLSQLLHQAQWSFLRQSERAASPQTAQLDVYTPHGYTRQLPGGNRFIREV